MYTTKQVISEFIFTSFFEEWQIKKRCWNTKCKSYQHLSNMYTVHVHAKQWPFGAHTAYMYSHAGPKKTLGTICLLTPPLYFIFPFFVFWVICALSLAFKIVFSFKKKQKFFLLKRKKNCNPPNFLLLWACIIHQLQTDIHK